MHAGPTMTESLQRELGQLFRYELVALAGNLSATAFLYHYTRPERALDILRSGHVRAYCIEEMNDPAEILYAVSIARAHIDRFYATETDEAVVPLFRALQQQTNGRFRSHTVFTVSFSTDGDEIGMWGLYADRRRGVSLCVRLTDANQWALANDGYLARVAYDPDAIDALVARALRRIRELFVRDFASGTDPDPAVYADLFLKHAIWFAPLLKPKVWSPEQEWRAIFVRTEQHHLVDGTRHFVLLPEPPIKALCLAPEFPAAQGPEYQNALAAHGLALFKSNHGAVSTPAPPTKDHS